jgi:hypothetical protein
VLAVAALWLDAMLNVKVIHRIESRTQAARRNDNIDVVWKFFVCALLLVGLCSGTYGGPRTNDI